MTNIKYTDKTHEYRRNYYRSHYKPYKKKVYYLKSILKDKIDLENDQVYGAMTEDKDRYEYLLKKNFELKCASL